MSRSVFAPPSTSWVSRSVRAESRIGSVGKGREVTNFIHGLTALGSGEAIAFLLLGTFIGVFIGVIPGLGGSVVLSMVLSFVYHIDLTGTLCLFLGAQAGSYFSASITSILLNTPAHPEAFAVTFDGFPMAQKGQAGRALGISAASTCMGGLVGCAILVGFIQVINSLPNLFHPPEYVALVLLAMILCGTLGTNSVAKPLISAGLGIMTASIGASAISGQYRYTFGQVGLYGGVSLVAVALGAFAIPQMVMVFGTATNTSRQDMTGRDVGPSQAVQLEAGFRRQVMTGVADTFRRYLLVIQSGTVGALVGIVPGVGGFAANFMSYGIAESTSRKNKGKFGTGIPEGIIAPEGSSLAKEAGSLVPIIGLGIPGSVGGSLFIAALTIKGIKTGYGFTSTYPSLSYEMVWIIALSGIIGTVVGVLVAPVLARVTKVPGPILVPIILSLAVIGPFLATATFFATYEVFIFGALGLLLRRLRYSLASFVIGLVLGPTFENNVYLTHNVYPGLSFITARPGADAVFVVAIAVLVLKGVGIRREKRKELEVLEATFVDIADPRERAAAARRRLAEATPYPLLSVITTLLVGGLGAFFIIYGWQYGTSTKLMPLIGGFLALVPAVLQLPNDIRRYLQVRKARHRGELIVVFGEGSSGPDGLAPAGAMDQPPASEPLGFGDPLPVSGVGAAVSVAASGRVATVTGRTVEPEVAADSAIEDMPPAPNAVREFSWGRNGQYTREIAAYAWLLSLVLACALFGFVWGIPAFCLVYGLSCTGRFLKSIQGRVTFAVATSAVMWLVATEVLKFSHVSYSAPIHL
jgi:putative tricarboxylic transport membrane protein